MNEASPTNRLEQCRSNVGIEIALGGRKTIDRYAQRRRRYAVEGDAPTMHRRGAFDSHVGNDRTNMLGGIRHVHDCAGQD
ncbi:unannotated protein [freshwater metagenome]|uniref:Unannotated protein n=1 Tax=freshwater metagenome TaxID=449393 RepID=A0A6J6T9A9_9ZZZZ